MRRAQRGAAGKSAAGQQALPPGAISATHGLPNLDPSFDGLIAEVLPYLRAFMGEPQLIKPGRSPRIRARRRAAGTAACPPPTTATATVTSARACSTRSTFSPTTGLMTARSALQDRPALARLSGSRNARLVAAVGALLLFSEAVIHDGLPKTYPPHRSARPLQRGDAHDQRLPLLLSTGSARDRMHHLEQVMAQSLFLMGCIGLRDAGGRAFAELSGGYTGRPQPKAISAKIHSPPKGTSERCQTN